MWGAVVALFRFLSVTLLNSCYFVLDHLHLAIAWLSSFSAPINIVFELHHLYLVVLVPLFTFFSFQIKNFLWDHLKNILPVGSNVEVLNREFNILIKETLKDVEDRIQNEVDGAVMKKATEQVEGWMKRVKDLQPTVESVIADYNNRSYFSNIYSLSTRAVNELKEVRKEANFIKGVTTYTRATSLPSVQQMPAVPIKFGRKKFESRLQKALNFLRYDEEGVLGIWGMGGVGKTTLLEHINNTMEKNFSSFGFDKVVFVTASRESTTLKIQKELMKKLGLPEGGDDQIDIFNYLHNESFLLLVDDLWEGQDLKKVGVPLPLGIVGEHKLKRKLILTTRSHRVCSKMGARHTINMECLSTEDARLLFRYNAGVDAAMIQSSPLIGELADKVADECDGLPIALITTGQALAETETVQVWENALQLLRESKLSQIPGMDDPLPLLKISYDHLKDSREKECLLHCALWPEDWLISKDELIQSWMGHGLLGKSDSLQKAYNIGHAIISNLVNVCLLENPKVLDDNMLKNDWVKLHDVIRGMALWIARGCGADNDNKWVVLSEGWEMAPQEKQTWSEVQKMSLWGAHLSNWPFGNQNFPNLTTLIINGFSQKMDMSFLKHLNALKYLDLSSYWGIEKFPIEICGLNKLEYLNLSYACIGGSLPEELKNLKNLKHLLLRDARISTVPVDLLSNLVSLRELDLFDINVSNCQSLIIDRLDFQEGCLDSLGINVSSVLDFQKLTRLPVGIFIRALCITKMEDWTSPSLELLSPKFLGSHNIQFSLKTLAIGRLAESIEELVIEEKCRLTSLDYLRIHYCEGLKGIMLWKGVNPKEVFPNLRSLFIFGCHQLKNVAWIANLPRLERVELERCNSMEQSVIWEQGMEVEESGRIFFPSLRILTLWSLSKLSSICDPALTFHSLEYLIVAYCPQLTKLPFQSPASCLNLKKIRSPKSWWDDTLQMKGEMKAFLDPLVEFFD